MVTVLNGVNNHMVGPIFDFCLENHDKMGGPAFQPVSFTGRDEEISDEDRLKQRYTTSHLAHDLAKHSGGKIDPHRDWYPLGASTAFASLADHLKGPQSDFGQLNCGCHPNCGAATMMVANSSTGEWATLMSFFNIDQFFKDLDVVVDSARGKAATVTQIGLSFLRNFDQTKAPKGMTPLRMLELFDGKMGGTVTGDGEEKKGEWRITTILSMWFQDLWNYDFRRTEMCVIPYGTQEGEISFCAYNTGVGWRNIIEEMRQVATTKDWFAEKGRHQIYAGDRPVEIPQALKRKLPVVSVEGGNGKGSEHAAPRQRQWERRRARAPRHGRGRSCQGRGRRSVRREAPGRLRHRLRLPLVAPIAPGRAAESRRRFPVECRRCGLPRPRAHAVTLSASDSDVARQASVGPTDAAIRVAKLGGGRGVAAAVPGEAPERQRWILRRTP